MTNALLCDIIKTVKGGTYDRWYGFHFRYYAFNSDSYGNNRRLKKIKNFSKNFEKTIDKLKFICYNINVIKVERTATL